MGARSKGFTEQRRATIEICQRARPSASRNTTDERCCGCVVKPHLRKKISNNITFRIKCLTAAVKRFCSAATKFCGSGHRRIRPEKPFERRNFNCPCSQEPICKKLYSRRQFGNWIKTHFGSAEPEMHPGSCRATCRCKH